MRQLNMQLGLVVSKALSNPQCNFQQTIIQYVNGTSFTMRMDESSVDTLVGILHKSGWAYGLEMNWHKNVAYWCGQGTPPNWVEK